MTGLLRARGAASEMAAFMDARIEPDLLWKHVIWTGEQVPVVWRPQDGRQLTTMAWGLPATAYGKPPDPRQRGSLFPRDLAPGASRLEHVEGLSRCLIIIESFAYPAGTPGQRTRCWIGLEDTPYLSWAGLCTADGQACAGMLVTAHGPLEHLGHSIPLILPPSDHDAWLGGSGLLSLTPASANSPYYQEDFGERWSTGEIMDEGPDP